MIFCQAVDSKSITFNDVVESTRANIFTLGGLYYIMFFVLMIGVLVGGKMCARYENDKEKKLSKLEMKDMGGDPDISADWLGQVCDDKNRYILNCGVTVLVLGVVNKVMG